MKVFTALKILRDEWRRWVLNLCVILNPPQILLYWFESSSQDIHIKLAKLRIRHILDLLFLMFQFVSDILSNRLIKESVASKVESNHSDSHRLRVWSPHSGPPKVIKAERGYNQSNQYTGNFRGIQWLWYAHRQIIKTKIQKSIHFN